MSLLDRPEARALLEDATIQPADVQVCRDHLTDFLKRYLPLFYRRELRELATVVIQGRLSALERKTSEPIAYQAGRHRKPVQHFVGAGAWDDEAVTAELRQDVAEEIGDPNGVLSLDTSGFAKKGTASCGVARQWCNRLGKVDNCQIGVFLSYAAKESHTLVDRCLYLPRDWVSDRQRRRQTHVPAAIAYRESWRIGLDLLDRSASSLPHGWIAGDDEFGRASAFRAELRRRHERYVLDVPANTLVREVAPRRDGKRPAFEPVEQWAARQPAWRWKTLTVRAGEKGPLQVRALKRRVQTKEEGGRVGASETLVVMRTLGREPQWWYTLSNAPRRERLAVLVEVHSERHRMEQSLQEGKGEVGLGQYEVRSWVGWHHHMTLSMLALWFVTRERRQMGKKNPGDHAGAGAGDLQRAIASAAAESGADREASQPCVAA